MARRNRKKQKAAEDHPFHWIMAAALLFLAFIALPDLRAVTGFLLMACLLGLPVSLWSHRQKQQRTLALRDLQSLSHRELELHVARVLNALPGWQAEATRGSSDQGADVIANGPGGVKVAVQVKHYRNNVGNKAVQEIVASMAYYRCTHAVVFTSGPGYTKAAHDLARANNVPLWGPDDLFRLQESASKGEAPSARLLPTG